MITIEKQGEYCLVETEDFYEIYVGEDFVTCYNKDQLEQAKADMRSLTGKAEVMANQKND